MMTHAIDNPAPTTIILMSGDRDFMYAVSVLALRQHRVVVIAQRDRTHFGLINQAEAVYQWPDDFLSDLSRASVGCAPGTGQRKAAQEPDGTADSQLESSPGTHQTNEEKTSTSHILVSRPNSSTESSPVVTPPP